MKARFWRCVPRAYVHTILECGPSFTQLRRYSVRGEFGAIHLSSTADLARLEFSNKVGDSGEEDVCLEFEVSLDKILDLTQERVRRSLGVQLADLVKDRLSAEAYQATQALGRAAYLNGIKGIVAPSVHDPEMKNVGWHNLIVYPGNAVRAQIRRVGGNL